MQYQLFDLSRNAHSLNDRYYCGSYCSLAQDIESGLRELNSYSSYPGYMIEPIEQTINKLLECVSSSTHLTFFEKVSIQQLANRLKSRIEIRLHNPKHLSLSSYLREKLLSLKYHGYTGDIVITSGSRTVEDQARIMYENIIAHGIDEQLKTYYQPGKNVINTYNPKLSRSENIANMARKIHEEGPENVSKHIADSSQLNVIDIDKRTLSNVEQFKAAAKSAGFTKILDENNCIHVEIPQPY